MTALPACWRHARLDEITHVTLGQSPPGDTYNSAGDGVPFFQGKSEFTATYAEVRKYTTAGAKFASEGDILVSVRAPVGPTNIAPVDCAIGRGLAGLRALEGLDQRYLLWALRATEPELASRGAGSTFPAVTGKQLRSHRINVAPLDEQRRIVDILEDHLSRLDAAERGFAHSLRRLASYEASALSRCREGDERSLSDLTEIQGGIQKQPKREPKQNAYPFLRVANVTKVGLDLNEVHLVELFEGELDRMRLQAGDLLVVEGNGSASQIGRAALWDGSIEDCVHQNHLIRVRPKAGLSASYLEAVWNSPQTRRQLTHLASSSSGLHTLSVSKLKSLRLPLPSLDRQVELVADVLNVRDRRWRLTAQLNSAASRTRQLRRALLHAAFSGRLTGRSSDLEIAEELSVTAI